MAPNPTLSGSSEGDSTALGIAVGEDVGPRLLRGTWPEPFKHVRPNVHRESTIAVNGVQKADICGNSSHDWVQYSIHHVASDERHIGPTDRLGNLLMQAVVIRTVDVEQPFVWLGVNHEEVMHDFVEVAELAPPNRYLLRRHEPNNVILLIDSDLPCK